MERYKRFQDAGTGIVAFLPRRLSSFPSLSATILHYAKQGLFGFPIALLRSIIALPVIALYAVLSGVAWVIPIEKIRGIFQGIINGIILRILLILLGFQFTEEKSDKVTIRKLQEKPSEKFGKWSAKGSVIVTNAVDLAQIVYLAARFSPTFVIPPNKNNDVGKKTQDCVKATGLLGALLHFASYKRMTEEDAPDSFEDVVKNAPGPVVVFAEGAMSNGRGLLDFYPFFDNSASSSLSAKQLHLAVFSAATPFAAGSVLVHILSVLTTPFNTIKVFLIKDSDEHRWDIDYMRTSMAAAAKIQKLATDANDKWKFMEYYNTEKDQQ
eukprot:comp18241_c0_seq1/m.32256 comp18241_c0_seq1/g.32256  ORF comp18241_c0_seq1/g.32256 comp18241_c0_seq1/m.32256 type:complete len:325 (-) comp18241_c0_seq1:39-1013(-)